MKVQSFEDFSGGLDTRKPHNINNKDTLRRLRNAYVTSGQSIRTRPGLRYLGDIEAGGTEENGLGAYNGSLQIFSTTQSGMKVLGAGTPFEIAVYTHKIKYDEGRAAESAGWQLPNSGSTRPGYVSFCGGFNSGMYASVKFGNGRNLHYYIPDDDLDKIGSTVSPISDDGCPHTQEVTIASSKVWAAKGNSVAYSATSKPTDWSSSDNAGFLATGDRSPGSSKTTGLGVVSNRLVVFHEDAAQIWATDPDPTRNELEEIISGIGTRWSESIIAANKDLFFLSDVGIRSIGGQSMYRNMKGSDVGSPIDELVQEHIREHEGRVDGNFYAGAGQYWITVGDETAVLTKSSRDRLEAWSVYTFAIPFGQMAHVGDRLYVRYNNSVYVMDQQATLDGEGQEDAEFEITVETPFYSFGTEGQFKQFQSMEAILEGYGTIDHCVNPNDNEDRTAQFQLAGDTRPHPTIPLGILAPALSTKIVGQSPNLKSINSLIYRYETTSGGI